MNMYRYFVPPMSRVSLHLGVSKRHGGGNPCHKTRDSIKLKFLVDSEVKARKKKNRKGTLECMCSIRHC